jgi:hypothetical protein
VSSPPHVVAACPASLVAQAARAARTGGWRKRAAAAAAAACVGREGRRGGQRRAFRFLPASRSVTFYNHGMAGQGRTPQHRLLSSRHLPLALRPDCLGLLALPACLCLSVCRSRRLLPFCTHFNRSLPARGFFFGAPPDAKALSFHPPPSVS